MSLKIYILHMNHILHNYYVKFVQNYFITLTYITECIIILAHIIITRYSYKYLNLIVTSNNIMDVKSKFTEFINT